MHNVRGTRGGKRGNDFNRSVKIEASSLVPTKSITAAKTIPAKVFYSGHEIEEVYDPLKDKIIETLVEDKSLTNRQHLKFGVQRPLETVDLRGKQVDLKSRCLIDITNPHTLSKTPRSLLRESDPFSPMPVLKRETSISKRIKVDEDASFSRERIKVDVGVELDFDDTPKLGRTSGKIHKSKLLGSIKLD